MGIGLPSFKSSLLLFILKLDRFFHYLSTPVTKKLSISKWFCAFVLIRAMDLLILIWLTRFRKVEEDLEELNDCSTLLLLYV